MVDHKSRRTIGGAPPPAGAKSGGGGWIAIILVVGALFAIGRCSSSSTSSSSSADVAATTANAQEAIGTAITAQAPPAVEALSRASVRQGVAHLKLAATEGLAGEMIYSQNCYDALSRHFSWAKLDTCGAFDTGAVQMLGDSDEPSLDKEIAWFQSETAAGRYLKAATAAGEDASEADGRISDLQARVARYGLAPKPQASAAVDEQTPSSSTPASNESAVNQSADEQ